jgi:myo-inositol-1(or 4)-monophosphatase
MDQVIPVVKHVGELILLDRESFTWADVEFKGQNDLVSYVDRNAEDRLVGKLSRLLAGCGFINEEGGHYHADAEAVWIIDPLDGTTNFVHGVPFFCTSVALQWQGQICMGIIYEPNRDELYTAIRGQGAYLNGARIQVSSNRNTEDAFLSTGFPYRKGQNIDGYLNLLRAYMGHIRGIRRMGSAAMDLAFTAAGRFDGFFEASLNPWDVAAGALLVQEAGGTVTDYWGQQDWLFGQSILAANTALHPGLLRLMTDYLHAHGLKPGDSLG